MVKIQVNSQGKAYYTSGGKVLLAPENSGEKYGITVDALLGDVNANGVLQQANTQSEVNFTGVTDIADFAGYYKFTYVTLKSVTFPDLTTISGNSACNQMFRNAKFISASFPLLTTISGSSACAQMFLQNTSLTSVSLPSLTTVSGYYGCNRLLDGCTNLTSVSLSNLTTISGSYGCAEMIMNCPKLASISLPNLTTINNSNGCNSMFRNDTSLTSAYFPLLTTISGSSACYQMFGNCTKITDVYFNSLTTNSFDSNTNQFSSMMSSTGTTVTHTLHFPSNLESTIQGLTGYPLFGGTSGYVVLAYDLPATS